MVCIATLILICKRGWLYLTIQTQSGWHIAFGQGVCSDLRRQEQLGVNFWSVVEEHL